MSATLSRTGTATDCWPEVPGARRPSARLVAIAAVLDAAALLAFVAMGRRSHEDDPGLGNLFEIAAPFLIAAALGWAVMRLWQAPLFGKRAIGMWLITVAAGMVLRNLVFDRGTALTFVILTTVVLAVFLLGWRAVAEQVRRRS